MITGGAGYIGYSVMQYLQENGKDSIEEIVVYDNLSRKNYAFFQSQSFREIPIRFIEGELLDERKLQKALAGINTVLHLAAKVTTPHSDQDAHFFDQVNHWGTALLCSAIEKSDVEHLVYMSSTSVYGRTEEAVDESYEPHPFSFYAMSKWQAEQQIHRLRDQLKVHIIRSGNVYGLNPALRIDAVINKFMFNAHFNGRITILGDGTQQRTFIHVDKLAQICSETLLGDIPAGTYNAVEHNMAIDAVAAYLVHIYPDLEQLHVNYNVLMHRLKVKTPCTLFGMLEIPKKGLLQELKEFKEGLAFG